MTRGFDLHFLLHNATLHNQLEHLRKEGHYLRATCPRCKCGTRSFYAGSKSNYTIWRCQSCGHSDFTTTLLGLGWTSPPTPAVKAYKAKAEVATTPIREVYRSLADFAQAHLSQAPDAIAFLANRGLNWKANHQVKAFMQNVGLGYLTAQAYHEWFTSLDSLQQHIAVNHAGLPDGSKQRLTGYAAMFAGGYKGKIVFPYFNQSGEVVDIRTRSISPKDTINGKPVRYTSPTRSNTERGIDVPYGVERIGYARKIVLTEGEFKSLVPMAHGSIPIVGLRGTGDFMPDYLPYFRNRLVILAFDNDDKKQANGLTAGQAAIVRQGRLLKANDIAVMVLNPARLGDQKGIDDFVNAYGIDAFNALVQPAALITLTEFEAELVRAGCDLSKFVNPKADPGTIRQWTPTDQVDVFAHEDKPVITLEEAITQIDEAVNRHVNHYKRGQDQLLITVPAGVGKTHTAIARVRTHTAATQQTFAVVLPNHATIDEKIMDGTLEGFQHIYGHNDENCKQNEAARNLTAHGYSPGETICPNCPALTWCKHEGYKAQFAGKANRAYVHAHLHTSYPGGEDIVIADELTHESFITQMSVWPGDITITLQHATRTRAERALLEALLQIFAAPDLSDLDGATFYEVLERFYPALRDVDAWGDGSLVQAELNELAKEIASGRAGELPQQFGEKLFSALSEDVRRLNAGQRPTGRVRLVAAATGKRCIEITSSKGPLPGWYNTRPVMILNATADADIMRDLLGPLKALAPQVAIAAGNQVTQDITYNNAKSSYAGSSPEAQKRRQAWHDNIRQHIAQHPDGEADTTIVCAKATEGEIKKAFPLAKIAHYGALEGRNDLQAGLTILANSVPINLEAIMREASALWPGIDTTLTRTTVAFSEENAGGEALAIEQIDGLDPRLQKLIWQHRDAPAIQAVHRSRIIRQTGRKVVVMFSRPIPGLKPTQIIKDYAAPSTKRAEQKHATIQRLVEAGKELIADVGGFTVESLAMVADASVNTARKYWVDAVTALDCNYFDAPVRQTLVSGATRQRTLRMAIPKTIMQKHQLPVDHERYQYDLIAIVIHMQPLLPHGWMIDQLTLSSLMASAPPAPEPAPTPTPLPGRWAMLRNPQGFKRSLELARASADPMQRSAYRVVVDWFNGCTDDKWGLSGALWAMGESYAINWH